MTKIIIIIMSIAICGVANAEKNTFVTPDELSNFFKVSHESRDYDSISSLVNWDGVRKPMRKKIEVYTSANFGLKIKDITIEKVEKDQFKKVKLGNNNLTPNLLVSHRMKIHFDVDKTDPKNTEKDTAVYLLGKKEEQYMIAIYVKETSSTDP